MHERVRADEPGVTIDYTTAVTQDPEGDGGFDDGVAAWEDGACVGHIGAMDLDLTVPGGTRLTALGLSRVRVAASHANRGVRTALTERLLDDARLRGLVLATVRADEDATHDRHGFGIASDSCSISIDPRHALPVHQPAEGTVRELPSADVAAAAPEAYDRFARARVGTILRTEAMWRRLLDRNRVDDAEVRWAVHEDSTATTDGLVQYVVPTGDPAGPVGPRVGSVLDLFAVDAAVERALWSHVLSTDGVDEWHAERRPVDDPLRLAVANLRALRVERRCDERWLRLLDVDVALGARTYGPTDRSVTIQVVDPLFSANSGTWRIDAYGSFRSHNGPELVTDIASLSAVYLGGTSWRELHEAGRIRERRAGAIADADALFTHRPAPFCGTPH